MVVAFVVVGDGCGCLFCLIAVTLVATRQNGKCQDVKGKYEREEFHRGKCRVFIRFFYGLGSQCRSFGAGALGQNKM